MSITTSAGPFDQGTGQRYARPGGQPDDRLEGDLDALRSAILIGAHTVEEVEQLAPKQDRPYIRAALEHKGAMRDALRMGAFDHATGTPTNVTFEQRAQAIIWRAQSIRRATEHGEQRQVEWEADHLCPITGRVDPTTEPRRMPWANSDITYIPAMRMSETAYRAVHAAWLRNVPEDDIVKAEEWLARQGILPEPTKQRRK